MTTNTRDVTVQRTDFFAIPMQDADVVLSPEEHIDWMAIARAHARGERLPDDSANLEAAKLLKKQYADNPSKVYTIAYFVNDAIAGAITEETYRIYLDLVMEGTPMSEERILRFIDDELDVQPDSDVRNIDPFVMQKVVKNRLSSYV